VHTDLYKAGDAIWFANIGSLVEPVTWREWRYKHKRVPARLFSHLTQSETASSVHHPYSKGILGRIMDQLNSQKQGLFRAASYSIAGKKKAVEASMAASSANYIHARKGVEHFQDAHDVGDLIHNISKAECGSLFAETFASTLAETLTVDNTLGPLFAKAPKPKNDFGGGLGQELTQVMKLIRIGKDTLKNEREVYVTNAPGGYDTHQDHKTDTKKSIDAMMTPIGQFVKELKEQNLWQNVTIVCLSEFGRTTTSNGLGTDHGWGGNTAIMGGALKGGQVLGKYPENLLSIEGRGRWIPTTPWEGMWTGIAEWMGVHKDNLQELLPFSENFERGKTLYTKEQMFKAD